MIINRIYEHQNLLSLQVVSFLVGLRTYQHPCSRVGQLFYITVHSLRWASGKHVGICALEHYCNYSKVYAFVGHIVTI
jgi:hypothetical protein